MVYQLTQVSPWHYVFMYGIFLLVAAIILIAYRGKKRRKLSLWSRWILFVVAIGFLGAFVMDDEHRIAQNDSGFSKQLMDEYHVTSSRSIAEIRYDFRRFDEARTVFTKDGKETPIFIQQIHSDDRQVEMAFTVIDDKALYPKANQ